MDALSLVLRRYERIDPDAWVCLHFALEASAACGGRDLTPLVPPHRTRLEALRALRASGYPSLIELMDAHATPIKPLCARTGDVAYRDQPPIGAMGVVLGGEAVFLNERGFVRFPLCDVLAWRLG